MPFFKTGFVPLPDLGRDTVATMLRGEEYVVNPVPVRRIGVSRFDALNAGRASIITNAELSQLHQAIAAFQSGRAHLPFGQTAKFLSMLQARASSLSPSFGADTFIHRASGGYVASDYTPSVPSYQPDRGQMLRMQPPAAVASTSAPAASDPELKQLML